MMDAKNRELAPDNRITVPGQIEGIEDGIVRVTLLAGSGRGTVISVPGDSVLRCEDGDNNGVDASVMDGVKEKVDAHFEGEMESRRSTLASMDAEIGRKQNEHAARVAALDAEYETRKAIHVARIAAVEKVTG